MAEQMLARDRIREAVGVFDHDEELDAAVAELENTAFPRHDISVLGRQQALKKKYGTATVDPDSIEDSPDVPRNVPVMPEEKTIGAAVLAGAGVYAGAVAGILMTATTGTAIVLAAVIIGGLLGGAAGLFIVALARRRMKRLHSQQIRKGGMVLWVRTPDEDKEKLAQHILGKHGARHIHIHEIG